MPKRTHGHTAGRREGRTSPTYNSWMAMKRRCSDPKHPHFALYGGRGVRVCWRWWLSFEAFLADMGERPAGHSLDRIDSSKGYEPGNCRWATRRQQSANRRDNVLLTMAGETHNVEEWARRTGLKAVTIRQRIKHGWSSEEALTPTTRRSP